MSTRETAAFERKANVSKNFLKTVSAYANYGTGKIAFGIDDKGDVLGLEDPVDACMRIENMINDSIDPVPRYILDLNSETRTVMLTVFQGAHKPYLAHGKAYRRSDSATVEVDRLEYGRLVLEGNNQTFDELPAGTQNFEFHLLEKRLKEKLGIEKLDADIMKTLELLTLDGVYTNAAAMLADENNFKGIDIVRFGSTISEMMERTTLEGTSALLQLESALDVFDRYYLYEKIDGNERTTVELVPHEAFREAVANAIVHKAWDTRANITVSMLPDRIEIASPGALPADLSTEEYLGGHISVLRNPILANVFFRLRYIEKFGTGVLRIQEAYEGSNRKPTFDVRAESIVVVLPVAVSVQLTSDEQSALEAIPNNVIRSRTEVEKASGFSKDKTIRVLNSLVDKGVLMKQGSGRSTKYRRA